MMARLLGLVLLALVPAGASEWINSGISDLGKLAGGAEVWRSEVTSGATVIYVTGVSFRSSTHTLAVFDQPATPREKLADVAPAAGAIAGINASYFHDDFRPLGLVVTDGNIVHKQERAKLLSGIVAVRGKRIELLRPGNFRGEVTAAIQSGPWLVENGKPVAGLDSEKRARRTVIATDGKGRWALLATSPASLSLLATALSSGQVIPDWKPASALNLDGGGSTALWAATPGSPVSVPEYGTVRNFLLLFPN